MSILAAYAVPHPPLIIPSVGKGEERAISDTTNAYKNISRRIKDHKPQTIIITSPHAPMYRDSFFVSSSLTSEGSMQQFGVFSETIEIENDVNFQKELIKQMKDFGIPSTSLHFKIEELDHASFVPLYFILEQFSNFEIVRVGLSGLPDNIHFSLGQLIARVSNDCDRRCILVASGDLSHKLKEDGPYGFNEAGPKFDKQITQLFSQNNLKGLFDLDANLCYSAAECGLRSFEIMAGAMNDLKYSSELLSYEGPFGVGYSVAAFEVK